jgi:hypothetical protein
VNGIRNAHRFSQREKIKVRPSYEMNHIHMVQAGAIKFKKSTSFDLSSTCLPRSQFASDFEIHYTTTMSTREPPSVHVIITLSSVLSHPSRGMQALVFVDRRIKSKQNLPCSNRRLA